jgi:hypothetical protein
MIMTAYVSTVWRSAGMNMLAMVIHVAEPPTETAPASDLTGAFLPPTTPD